VIDRQTDRQIHGKRGTVLKELVTLVTLVPE